MGIIQGLHLHGLSHDPIIAVETRQNFDSAPELWGLKCAVSIVCGGSICACPMLWERVVKFDISVAISGLKSQFAQLRPCAVVSK
jgi:hypothetical protein